MSKVSRDESLTRSTRGIPLLVKFKLLVLKPNLSSSTAPRDAAESAESCDLGDGGVTPP